MPSSPALRCKHIRNPLWDELGSAFRVLAAPADADLLACDIKNTLRQHCDKISYETVAVSLCCYGNLPRKIKLKLCSWFLAAFSSFPRLSVAAAS